MTADRNFSLDAARGILIILGIFIHAANIYAMGGNWLISDPEKSSAIGVIADLIHAFRMPAFFWISGYFCARTYQRNGSQGLLQRRLPRLAIPLVATWLTLNLLQTILLALYHQADPVEILIRDGIPLYHLWFLVDLIVFVALAAVLLPLLRRFSPSVRRPRQIPWVLMMAALALASVLVSIVTRVTGLAYEPLLGLTSLYRLASNLPFFAAGMLMCVHAGTRQNFLRTPALLALATIPLAVFCRNYARGSDVFQSELAFFGEQLFVWVSLAAVLGFFHSVIQRESNYTRFFSEAAYTIYLSHHLVVFSIGALLIPYSIGAWQKYLIVCGGTLVLTSLFHIFIIRRSHWARLLFNGKRPYLASRRVAEQSSFF
ncbi:MAG: acyltransferase family protein [Paucibacter sp.]|nr:acyltransferase family protein [Roseateles sp.]